MIKKISITIVIIAVALFIIKKKDMTLRQSMMKMVYPLLMVKEKLFASQNAIIANKEHIKPPASFYHLNAKKTNGELFSFNELKGKKVLLVNTASNCGYTPQYDELQELYKSSGDKLVIVAFPANDFKDQEKASNKDIETFCKVNFGVTFPLMQKSSVIKSAGQNEVFKWLSDKNLNGWNNKSPEWNFSKYLVDETGVLTHYFSPKISPLSKEITEKVELLNH
jgi:glutathione peroxidase